MRKTFVAPLFLISTLMSAQAASLRSKTFSTLLREVYEDEAAMPCYFRTAATLSKGKRNSFAESARRLRQGSRLFDRHYV
jgi:hypothetical protein